MDLLDLPQPYKNVARKTLSPRGFTIFGLVVAALISLATWQIYAGSGFIVDLVNWARASDDRRAIMAVTVCPAVFIGVAVGYLHDFIFKLGLFDPKRKKQPKQGDPLPPRPYDRLRDW
jgi:Mn2+/Fe2+ NRAMP family transporter